jgi:hypothetical protein
LTVVGNKLAQMFADDNPRFDWDRFAAACKPEEGEHSCGACQPG